MDEQPGSARTRGGLLSISDSMAVSFVEAFETRTNSTKFGCGAGWTGVSGVWRGDGNQDWRGVTWRRTERRRTRRNRQGDRAVGGVRLESRRAAPAATAASEQETAGDLIDEVGAGGETHQTVAGGQSRLTTQQGVPVADDQNTLRAGERGPSLLEDFHFREKIFHFDHERIPERVVHARGFGAHGFFEPYESLADADRGPTCSSVRASGRRCSSGSRPSPATRVRSTWPATSAGSP